MISTGLAQFWGDFKLIRARTLRCSRCFVIAIRLCPVFFLSTDSNAEIIGSSHDFSSSAWSGGDACAPCHTPHNANAAAPGAPLWNRTSTDTTYTVYASSTLDVQPETPRNVSKLCLSCHDGMVALDSYGGNAGTHNISAEFSLGTNLSDDHPVSIRWQHQTPTPECTNCHPNEGVLGSVLPFYEGFVECASCHDVHNKAPYPKLLRVSLDGSALCLHCHGK